jgi:hypothetical protein
MGPLIRFVPIRIYDIFIKKGWAGHIFNVATLILIVECKVVFAGLFRRDHSLLL